MTALFEHMGCDTCPYRMKSQQGCYKFGLTKHEINKGAFICTQNHGAYELSKEKPCPHATRSGNANRQ